MNERKEQEGNDREVSECTLRKGTFISLPE
jgi:hypothetical protein